MSPTETAFHGIFPYLVSPIDVQGRVMEDVLRRLVADLIDAGVHGLTPLGSTGEGPYLGFEQRVELARVVVDAARRRVPVVPGVVATGTDDAIRQARAMADLGADGLVLALVPYFPLSEDAVVGYFTAVADCVSLPIVVYSNPQLQRFVLTPSMVERLAQHPNIRYLKDTSGVTGLLLTIRQRVGDRLGIFSASAHVPLFALMAGAVGWMAGPACLVPRLSVRLYHLARAGQWEEALAVQWPLWALNDAFQRFNLAACIKAGLEHLGYPVGPPLPPQRPLAPAEREELAGILDRLLTLERSAAQT